MTTPPAGGSDAAEDLQKRVVRRRDARLQRWGMRSWFVVGIAATGAIVFVGLSAISGLVIPLIVATVLAMLFAPLTDRLERYMPRALAAGLVLVVLVAVTIGAFVVAVDGVVDQAPQIGRQLAAGIEEVGDWLDEEGWISDDADSAVDDLGGMWAITVPGATTYVSTVFSSAAAFVVGTLVAVFLLDFGLSQQALAAYERLLDDAVGGSLTFNRLVQAFMGAQLPAAFGLVERSMITSAPPSRAFLRVAMSSQPERAARSAPADEPCVVPGHGSTTSLPVARPASMSAWASAISSSR